MFSRSLCLDQPLGQLSISLCVDWRQERPTDKAWLAPAHRVDLVQGPTCPLLQQCW